MFSGGKTFSWQSTDGWFMIFSWLTSRTLCFSHCCWTWCLSFAWLSHKYGYMVVPQVWKFSLLVLLSKQGIYHFQIDTDDPPMIIIVDKSRTYLLYDFIVFFDYHRIAYGHWPIQVTSAIFFIWWLVWCLWKMTRALLLMTLIV